MKFIALIQGKVEYIYKQITFYTHGVVHNRQIRKSNLLVDFIEQNYIKVRFLVDMMFRQYKVW